MITRKIIITIFVCSSVLSCATGGKTTYGDPDGGEINVNVSTYRTHATPLFNNSRMVVDALVNNQFVGRIPPGGRIVVSLLEGSHLISYVNPMNGFIVWESSISVP